MPEQEVRMTMRANVEPAVQGLRRVSREFQKAERAGVIFGTRLSQAGSAGARSLGPMPRIIEEQKRQLDDMGRRAAKVEKGLLATGSAGSSAFGGMLKSALIFTAAIAGLSVAMFALRRAFSAIIKAGSEFQKEMLRINTLVGLSQARVEMMADEILRISPQVTRGPLELAKALFVVTSAGQRGAEAMDIVRESAKVAALGLGETAVVARTVTAAMNAWGKETLSAARATEILLGIVREGNFVASDLARTVGRVFGAAAKLGVSFEQVGAFIATFTRLGVKANEAITSLRGVLNALLRPGTAAREAFHDLGTSVEQFKREIKDEGLASALLRLIKTAQELGDTSAIETIIPRIRALAGVYGVTGKQADKYRLILEILENKTDLAKRGFQAFERTVSAQSARAAASLETLATTMGREVNPATQALLEVYNIFLIALKDSGPVMEATRAIFVNLAKAIIVVAQAAVEAQTIFQEIVRLSEQFQLSFSKMLGPLARLGPLFGIGPITNLFKGSSDVLDDFQLKVDLATIKILNLNQMSESLDDTFFRLSINTSELAGRVGDLTQGMQELGGEFDEFAADEATVEAMAEKIDSLAQLAGIGEKSTFAFGRGFLRLRREMNRTRVDSEELAGEMAALAELMLRQGSSLDVQATTWQKFKNEIIEVFNESAILNDEVPSIIQNMIDWAIATERVTINSQGLAESVRELKREIKSAKELEDEFVDSLRQAQGDIPKVTTSLDKLASTITDMPIVGPIFGPFTGLMGDLRLVSAIQNALKEIRSGKLDIESPFAPGKPRGIPDLLAPIRLRLSQRSVRELQNQFVRALTGLPEITIDTAASRKQMQEFHEQGVDLARGLDQEFQLWAEAQERRIRQWQAVWIEAMGEVTARTADAFAEAIFEAESFKDAMISVFEELGKGALRALFVQLFEPLTRKMAEIGAKVGTFFEGLFKTRKSAFQGAVQDFFEPPTSVAADLSKTVIEEIRKARTPTNLVDLATKELLDFEFPPSSRAASKVGAGPPIQQTVNVNAGGGFLSTLAGFLGSPFTGGGFALGGAIGGAKGAAIGAGAAGLGLLTHTAITGGGLGALASPLFLSMAGPFAGLIAGSLLLPKLFRKDPIKSGRKEALRDFGVGVGGGDINSFLRTLGIDKGEFEPIRKDILSSPRFVQDVLLPRARAEGNIEQLISRFRRVEVSGDFEEILRQSALEFERMGEGFVVDLSAPLRKAIESGDFEEFNAAWGEVFLQSERLRAQFGEGIPEALFATGQAFQSVTDEIDKFAKLAGTGETATGAFIQGFLGMKEEILALPGQIDALLGSVTGMADLLLGRGVESAKVQRVVWDKLGSTIVELFNDAVRFEEEIPALLSLMIDWAVTTDRVAINSEGLAEILNEQTDIVDELAEKYRRLADSIGFAGEEQDAFVRGALEGREAVEADKDIAEFTLGKLVGGAESLIRQRFAGREGIAEAEGIEDLLKLLSPAEIEQIQTDIGRLFLPDIQKAIDAQRLRGGPPLPMFMQQIIDQLRSAGILELQRGGIVRRPTLAMIGEKGPEAVIPLRMGQDPMFAQGLGAHGRLPSIQPSDFTPGGAHAINMGEIIRGVLGGGGAGKVGDQFLRDAIQDVFGGGGTNPIRIVPSGIDQAPLTPRAIMVPALPDASDANIPERQMATLPSNLVPEITVYVTIEGPVFGIDDLDRKITEAWTRVARSGGFTQYLGGANRR